MIQNITEKDKSDISAIMEEYDSRGKESVAKGRFRILSTDGGWTMYCDDAPAVKNVAGVTYPAGDRLAQDLVDEILYTMSESGTAIAIKAILVKPGEEPAEITIGNDLHSLQWAVDGYIEQIVADGYCLLVNEEGLFNGSFPNKVLYDSNGIARKILFGNILIVGVRDAEFWSVPEEIIQDLLEEYGADKRTEELLQYR